jgi:hypothetical protein
LVASRGVAITGIRRNADRGRCTFCLGEDVKHILDCLETRNWRMKFLNDILRCTNEDQIRNLCRYLDRVRHKCFNKTKVV